MNIFVVDQDPIIAAQMLCDKHIIKMPTESGQMLSTAVRRHVSPTVDLYNITHKHHPCTVWAGDTRSNFMWLLQHSLGLIKEYDERYGKPGAYRRLRGVLANCERLSATIPDGPLTPFPQAMPEKYRISSDPVAAYRQYYVHDKARFAKWTKCRLPPNWWRNPDTCS